MADKVVAVGLTAQVASYVSGMNKASNAANRTAASTEKIGSSVDKTTKKMNTFRNIALYAFGYGIATMATRALTKIVRGMMDFEDSMANLGAASMATEAELQSMREAALQAGQDTVFTATEAADAMTELSKAGVSTADILGGALAGALDLASAGQVDVAFAAETAATAMVQFNLSGSQMSHVADLLAAGAGKAQGGVEDLALALRQGGQVASMVGWSFEDTTTALTAFAAAGLLGSDAGTSLKTMLLRLARPSNQAAEVMERYGLSVYDANGNMVGASELAGRLAAAFGDLDPKARNAAMGILFGTDAVRAANVLYSEGEAGIAEWADAVNDAGYAAEQAARKNDTLRGDLNKLAGTFESIINGSGGGFIDLLRGIAQAADEALKDTANTLDDINGVLDETVGSWYYEDKPLLPEDPEGLSVLGRLFKDFTDQVTEAVDAVLLLPLRLNQDLYPSLYEGDRAMDAWAARLTGAADAHDRWAASADGSAAAVDGAAGSAADSVDDLDEMAEAADEAEAELDALKDTLMALGGEFVGAQAATDAVYESINNLMQPVRDLEAAQKELADATDDESRAKAEQAAAEAEAQLALEGNSEAALDNRARLRDLRDQALESAAGMIEFGGDVDGARALVEDARQAVIDARIAMGEGEDQAEDYADELGLIPDDVTTAIAQYGMSGAQAAAWAYKGVLDGIPRYIVTRVSLQQQGKVSYGGIYEPGWADADGGWAGAGRRKKMASGGFVSGPGGGRSDMIPTWLSNGEFVVNAGAAMQWGPLLEAINGKGSFTVNNTIGNGSPRETAQAIVSAMKAQSVLMGV